jgi:hypothetical protein
MRGRIVGFGILLLLAACGGPALTPVANIGPTQTRAVELTQVAVELAPTATASVLPATETPAATMTPVPTSATIRLAPTPTSTLITIEELVGASR